MNWMGWTVIACFIVIDWLFVYRFSILKKERDKLQTWYERANHDCFSLRQRLMKYESVQVLNDVLGEEKS